MKTLEILVTSFCCFLINFSIRAQDLAVCKLTKEDKKDKLVNAYEYNATDHYAKISLCLFKDGTFYYALSAINQDIFSKGKWVKMKDTLILINGISNGNIPIKLTYSKDSTNLLDGFKIGIVKNLKGEEMPDGLVAINNDSIMCAPSYAKCDHDYASIDSIKIVFENGLSSKWIKIDNRDYYQIQPVLQTDFLMSSYMPFDNRKYLIKKSSLKAIQ